MITNFDKAMEAIGQAIDDREDINQKDTPEVFSLLSNIRESYVLVLWPESQDLMEEDWFEDEAVLDVDNEVGSSYFVPLHRVL